MPKITTDFSGTETTAVMVSRLRAISSYWFGSTATAAVTTWGALRSLMNGASTPAMTVAATELGASFLIKRSWLNDPDQVIPATIFAGRQGIWLDPSDFGSMFQDVAGAVPVTAVGQSVALIRDKSGRGNHATQATASRRPVLTRRPKTGQRNILPRNQWDAVPIGVLAADYRDRGQYLGGPLPASGIAAELVGKGVTDGISWVDIRYSGTNTAGSPQFRNIGSDLAQKVPVGATRVSYSHWVQVVGGSLSSGVSTYQFLNGRDASLAPVLGAGALFTPTATWQRYSAADLAVPANMAEATAYGMYVRFSAGATFDVTLRIGGGQVEYGSTVTALQNAASIYDLTEPGVQDCYGLMFDGVDDVLQTGNIAWGTDEVTVTAGLRKLSDAARGMVAELGPLANQRNFQLNAPSSGLNDYGFLSSGSATAVSTTAVAAPNTSVVTGQAKITTDTLILRRNAAQTGTSAADQGAGSAYDTNPLYIGMRAGTSLPFSGILFGLTAVNALLGGPQLAMMEHATNANTGGF
ncbi:hypothetical protein GCM10011452_06870 [Gemmobacter lanyuensis]|uniref:Uncharacterized protein n=1 Tax=Gemmobacter lanyuensis TaxID=1054497 RepID=A0A918IN63_9RHOB|nr:hypothetical protein [Gemmobacter lanyuensis]GGW22795.1 hypothetical protein GCM10011452_06870 [Gemmobacter lanyuensis]